MEHGIISAQALEKMIEERSYEELPPHLSGIAKPALDVLLQTRDGQECDMMLDRAAMETVYEAGKRSDMFFLSEYIEKRAALMNIKIAVRCCLTQKPLSFIKRALGPCETLDTDALALAASRDLDAVYDVLMFTSYRDAVEVLKQSLSAFETWSDNQLMAFTKSQKSNPFTLAPLIAYMLAVETEMKVVRLILTGKLNHLEEQVIRERMRELYG